MSELKKCPFCGAELEKYQNRYNGIRADEWISAEIRPTQEGKYLVHGHTRLGISDNAPKCIIDVAEYQQGTWWTPIVIDPSRVTHWMPLPEPPKEQDGKVLAKMNLKACAIVMAYTGIAMLKGKKLDIFYQYLAELFKRPVYTHEIPDLMEEIKEKSKADFLKLCAEAEKEAE